MSDAWTPGDSGGAGGGDTGALVTDLGDSMGGLPDSIAPNTDWGSSGDAQSAMQPGQADLNPGALAMPQQFTAADLQAPNPGQLTGGPQAVNMNLTTGGPPPPQSFYQKALAGIASMAPPGAAQPAAAQKIYAPLPVITPPAPTTSQRLAQIASGQIPVRPAWQNIR
jgi:hypothetical protein